MVSIYALVVYTGKELLEIYQHDLPSTKIKHNNMNNRCDPDWRLHASLLYNIMSNNSDYFSEIVYFILSAQDVYYQHYVTQLVPSLFTVINIYTIEINLDSIIIMV